MVEVDAALEFLKYHELLKRCVHQQLLPEEWLTRYQKWVLQPMERAGIGVVLAWSHWTQFAVAQLPGLLRIPSPQQLAALQREREALDASAASGRFERDRLRGFLTEVGLLFQRLQTPARPAVEALIQEMQAVEVDVELCLQFASASMRRLVNAGRMIQPGWGDDLQPTTDEPVSQLLFVIGQSLLVPSVEQPLRVMLPDVLEWLRPKTMVREALMEWSRLDGQDPTRLSAWFAAFIRLYPASTESQLLMLRVLHRGLVRDYAAPPVPALDMITLQPLPLKTSQLSELICRYEASDAPMGTVLGVIKFRLLAEKAEVSISLGTTPPAWTAWLQPPYPSERLCSALVKVREQVEMSFRRQDKIDPTRLGVEEWRRWLGTPAGEAWWHAFCHAAWEQHYDAEVWMQFLQEQTGIIGYPQVCPEGQLKWPEGAALPAHTPMRFDAAPRGTILAVSRFALRAERCQFEMSLGPREPGSRLDTAVRLQDALQQLLFRQASFVAPIDRFVRWSWSDTPPETIRGAVEAVSAGILEWIATHYAGQEGATNFSCIPPADASQLDELWSGLTGWATCYDLVLLPREWTFAQGAFHHQIAPTDITMSLVYRPDAVCGEVFRIRQWGLQSGDAIIRPAQVSVSAGDAPALLGDLEALLAEQRHEVAQRLLVRLKGWREASLEQRLEASVVQLFVDFWDSERPLWEAIDASSADEFGELFGQLLTEDCHLRLFYPKSYHDYPSDWVRLPIGSWMQTGRVVRVLRPGLETHDCQLRIPAYVEVE